MRRWALAVPAALMALALFLWPMIRPVPTMTAAEFDGALERGEIARVILLSDGMARVELADGNLRTIPAYDNPNWRDQLIDRGLDVRRGVDEMGALSTMMGLSLAAGAAWQLMPKKRGSLMAQRANTPPTGITLADVAGNPEAKKAMGELVDFLKAPEVYARTGARPPAGVLLWGPPGTGKTLLARALAGEAGVPFLAATGSDFVHMYAGMGAARVRELFAAARGHERCVVFIDEIDALGRRGADAASGERDQTLNALLTELSGFVARPGIMVVAATNRPDMLDDALTRPGRFDRKIHVGAPDVQARVAIFKLHASGKPLDASVVPEVWARRCVGFSGASIERMLNEAAIFAARRRGISITSEDMESAYLTVSAGTENAVPSATRDQDGGSKAASPSEKLRLAALHEAGHALVTHLLLPQRDIVRVSILSSGGAMGGFCLSVDSEEAYHDRAELMAVLAAMLGGRAAEELLLGADKASIGAQDDLKQATRLAWDMAARYGFEEEIGPLSWSALLENGLTRDDAPLRSACAQRLSERLRFAVNLLHNNKDALENITKALVERETLTGDELRAIVEPSEPKTQRYTQELPTRAYAR